MKKQAKPRLHPLGIPLLLATGLCLLLFLFRVIISGGSWRFWFINWNLLLAWLPLLFAVLLVRTLRTNRWLSWKPLVLTVLWLLFLPNSFYLVTDFIHLDRFGKVTVMFDIVLFMMYALTGLILGWLAVYIVHTELKKRKTRDIRWILLGLVFVLCSFAIYLGRNLGWNSWDVLANPAGIVIDVLQRLMYPGDYPDTFSTTALFFVFIAGTYTVFYTTIKALSRQK